MDMGLIKKIQRFEVWLVDLNPTKGSEIKKVRPCIVVSPNEINRYLHTVMVVPLTSTIRTYPTRVNCIFQGKNGQAMIDQMRGLDKVRFKKKLGVMEPEFCKLICDTLVEAFRWE